MQKLFFLVLVTLFSLTSLIARQNPDRVDKEEMTFLYNSGKYEKVLSTLSANHSDDYNFIGKCHWSNYQYDSAGLYFTKAYLEKDEPEEKILALLGLVDYYLQKVQLQNANKTFLKAEGLCKNASTENLELPLLFRKAKLLYHSNREESGSIYEQILNNEIKEENTVILNSYLYYFDLLLETDLQKADSVLEIAFKYAVKYYPENRPILTQIYLLQAYNQHVQGNYGRAIDIYENKVLSGLTGNEFWVDFLQSEYHRLSNFTYLKIRNHYQVIVNHEEFLRLAERLYPPNHERISEAYLLLADMYSYMNNYELSEDYFDNAMKLLANSEYLPFRINAFHQKGVREYDKGNFQFADKLFNIFHQLTEGQFGYKKLKLSVFYYQATIDLYNEEYEEAGNQIGEGLALIGENSPDYLSESIRLRSLEYRRLSKIKEFELAKTIAGEVLSDIDALGMLNSFAGIEFILIYSQSLMEGNRFEEASNVLQVILKANSGALLEGNVIENLPVNKLIVEVYRKRAVCFRKMAVVSKEYLEHSYQSYQDGILLLNKLKKTHKSERDKLKDQKFLQGIYAGAVSICYELFEVNNDLRYINQAFHFNQLSKSGLLQEAFDRNLAIKNSEIPDQLLFEIESLKEQISFFDSEIANIETPNNSLDSVRLIAGRLSLTEKKARLNALMVTIEEEYPNYYNLKYNQELETIESIQRKIVDNTALIEYFVGEEYIFAFIISKETVKALRLPLLDIQMISRFQKIILPENFSNNSQETYQEFEEISNYLYRKIIEKPLSALKDEGVNELIIIPDKSLNYLSFELLTSDKIDDSGAYLNMNYLLKDYSVVYGYSSTILFRTKRKQTDGIGKMLAVAPSYDELVNDTSQLASRGTFRRGFSKLAFNREEAEAVSEFFNGKVSKNDAANERSFLENHKSYDILHLAMHALVNAENPRYSKLVFTSSQDSLYDNYLHSFELYNMNIEAQLTVLSACNTGDGTLINGEGVMSLARAFTYAGSKSVVMSHWKVDDQSTNQLMQSFYRYLAAGKRKGESLRLAKLDYLSNASPNKQHPFFWGSFVVIGDDSAIKVKSEERLYYYLAAVGLVLLFLYLWYRKRS